MAKDPETVLEEAAEGPKSMSVSQSGATGQQHSLRELIEYANHKAASNAAKKTHFGLRHVKLIPPGGG